MIDFDTYDEDVDDGDGRDPLREDCFEDNMLMLYEASMTPDQEAEYFASLRMYEAAADSDTFSASVHSRLAIAQDVTGKRMPTVEDLFERITGGGFMDEVDLYRLIWDD